jgi:hypothetical protein
MFVALTITLFLAAVVCALFAIGFGNAQLGFAAAVLALLAIMSGRLGFG